MYKDGIGLGLSLVNKAVENSDRRKKINYLFQHFDQAAEEYGSGVHAQNGC